MGISRGKGSIEALQQQQQQLMAQIQLTHQALMLGQSSESADQLKDIKKDRERHASEHTLASSEGSLKENRPDNNNKVNGNPAKSPSPVQNSSGVVEKLFSHGHCAWPGCDTSLPDSAAFFRHLTSQHLLDDKSTAQTRVQMQIGKCTSLNSFLNMRLKLNYFSVNQLELQLSKEKNRLQGMMKHLNLELTKSGELKPIQANNTSHLQMLQSSVERASESIKQNEENKRSPGIGNVSDQELSSRMAAMAAMFPNLPTSIAATLGFPSSQSKSKFSFIC